MKRMLLLIILILLLIFGIRGIYFEFKEYREGEEEYKALYQYVNNSSKTDSFSTDNSISSKPNKKTDQVKLAPNEVTVDFNSLEAINSDCIAWILIPGTNVNYPIVKGEDNSYYVTHTFNKKVNKSGAIFIDMRNSLTFTDRNTIIYGHNLKNNKMFSDLKKFLTKSYLDNHRKIVIYTKQQKLTYEVFAVCKVMEDSEVYKVKFLTDELFCNHLDMIKNTASINYANGDESINRIITLSTCTNNLEGERIAVVARLIEETDN